LKNIKADDALYADLAEPIAVLKNWDYYANSVATTLANEWALS
jgi:nitrogen fixation protein